MANRVSCSAAKTECRQRSKAEKGTLTLLINVNFPFQLSSHPQPHPQPTAHKALKNRKFGDCIDESYRNVCVCLMLSKNDGAEASTYRINYTS